MYMDDTHMTHPKKPGVTFCHPAMLSLTRVITNNENNDGLDYFCLSDVAGRDRAGNRRGRLVEVSPQGLDRFCGSAS